MRNKIKSLFRKQNTLYRKFIKKGFKPEDKDALDRHRISCTESVLLAKEKYLKMQGAKLSDTNTTAKSYWKILNTFLNKCRLPRIPPLFVNNEFVMDSKEKAEHFNNFFSAQCTPFENQSTLPDFVELTDASLSSFIVTDDEIKDLLLNLDIKKAHGPDDI